MLQNDRTLTLKEVQKALTENGFDVQKAATALKVRKADLEHVHKTGKPLNIKVFAGRRG